MTTTSSKSLAKIVRDEFERQQIETWRLIVEDFDPSVQNSSLELKTTSGPQAKPAVCKGGELIEKAACNFTHSHGDSLPPAASERNPHLAGQPFSASALSVIVHPRHPYIPTAHMNVRFFYVDRDDPHWHFGGGMDLTPHFLNLEDIVLWHECAAKACNNVQQYETFKKQCDEYFFLPHRGEARGVGGLFFDDLVEPDFQTCLALVVRLCEQFRFAYRQIFNNNKTKSWGNEDEEWMLHRRSRYAEFNLIHDRGTKYGLQSGRRIESVLASLPPRASWEFEKVAQRDSEKALMQCLREPRDWL